METMRMKRRAFLGVGAASAAAAVARAPRFSGAAGIVEAGGGRGSRQALARCAGKADDERRRLLNIAECERGIRVCRRRHLISGYIPGQAVYNLGEYPALNPWETDERDENRIADLAAAGIGLVQLHEEWNDSLRLFGANKFIPSNKAGFVRFVRLAQARGMKVIVYASTGFFDRRDPDFRREWARKPDLVEIYWQYAWCSPASPGWRAYVLPRLLRIMDEYGVDGLYDDLGYLPLYPGAPERRAGWMDWDERTEDFGSADIGSEGPTSDEVMAFRESPESDGALQDFLGLVYGEVKRRGGILKIHQGSNARPRTEDKVYDYLWVGESVRNIDLMREAVKDHAPYVVPCLDMSRARIDREDDLYVNSVPFMQFPLLLTGKPFTGERGAIPGIKYPPAEKCFWTRHTRQIWKFHQEHPEGPHSFGWWDSCPGRPEAPTTYFRWLDLYRPMVEEGTRAYIDVAESDFFRDRLPPGVVASAFANRQLFLVLANFGGASVRVGTRGPWSSRFPSLVSSSTSWELLPRSLAVLTRDSGLPG
jgi:hypothetical protein